MDFTEIYKQTASLVHFSPGGHFILAAVQDRLIVRRSDSFQIVRTCLVDVSPSATLRALASSTKPAAAAAATSVQDGGITHAQWSADSELLLAACAKRGRVSVFKMRDEAWNASIEAGAEGLVKAELAPDARSVLCFSEWGLRVTVWSLVTGAATYIQYPVHPDRGYAFRADGRYFVLAERHKSKDTLGVYDAQEQYKLARHYPSPTSSLSSLSISPTGSHLAVWEGPLEYKLYILSLAGDLQGTFAPDVDPGFGIRTVAWHPRGLFLAIGGWDDKIYMLESLTWGCIATFELQSRIPGGVTIWREPSNWLEATQGRGFLSYERLQGPQPLSLTRADATKANPKSGLAQLEWNKTGTYFLARFESAPQALHIYAFPDLSHAAAPSSVLVDPPPFAPRLATVLIHARPVAHARWNPVRKGSLALCCAGTALYTWSDEWVGEPVAGAADAGLAVSGGGGEEEEMAECIGVPAMRFDARDLRWAPDGKGLVLLDKDTFCCAFEVEDADVEGETA